MERFGFEFVCSQCFETRGVLDGPGVPDACPTCGAHDPWIGPIARDRFDPREPMREAIVDSPFYLAAAGRWPQAS